MVELTMAPPGSSISEAQAGLLRRIEGLSQALLITQEIDEYLEGSHCGEPLINIFSFPTEKAIRKMVERAMQELEGRKQDAEFFAECSVSSKVEASLIGQAITELSTLVVE